MDKYMGVSSMVTAVFPAAGRGRRMQAGMNKVLLDLMGAPILVRTLLQFSHSRQIGYLIVSVAEDEVSFIRQMLRHVSGLKPVAVVAGGSERQYSIANGLRRLPEETDIVLVHDAARPLISVSTIDAVIDAARTVGGAIAAVPAKSTMKIVNGERFVAETPPREMVWEVQTPQGFRKDILLSAYEKAEQDGYLGTDDSCLVERLHVPIQVVESSYRNIKITTPEDILIAEALLREEANGMSGLVRKAARHAKKGLKEQLMR